MPDVPTLDATIMPGFDLLPWCGLSAPANAPPEVVDTLARTVQKALETPQLRRRFTDSGVEVFWGGPQEFEAYINAQLVNWTALIKDAGIAPE
jgi:tripartite-type tricarboxylate transporter receptor subunit TctC